MKSTKTTLSPQARLLLTQLERQYADATEADWDELREHLEERADQLAGTSPVRRQRLAEEFEAVRARALHRRSARVLLAALADGGAEKLRTRADGLEEWQVRVDGTGSALLFLPVDDPSDVGVTTARAALLSGGCPSCKRAVELTGGVFESPHNSRCPARSVLA